MTIAPPTIPPALALIDRAPVCMAAFFGLRGATVAEKLADAERRLTDMVRLGYTRILAKGLAEGGTQRLHPSTVSVAAMDRANGPGFGRGWLDLIAACPARVDPYSSILVNTADPDSLAMADDMPRLDLGSDAERAWYRRNIRPWFDAQEYRDGAPRLYLDWGSYHTRDAENLADTLELAGVGVVSEAVALREGEPDPWAAEHIPQMALAQYFQGGRETADPRVCAVDPEKTRLAVMVQKKEILVGQGVKPWTADDVRRARGNGWNVCGTSSLPNELHAAVLEASS